MYLGKYYIINNGFILKHPQVYFINTYPDQLLILKKVEHEIAIN